MIKKEAVVLLEACTEVYYVLEWRSFSNVYSCKLVFFLHRMHYLHKVSTIEQSDSSFLQWPINLTIYQYHRRDQSRVL